MINRFMYPILSTTFRRNVTSAITTNSRSLPLIRSPAVLGIIGGRNCSSGSSKSSSSGTSVEVKKHGEHDDPPPKEILGERLVSSDAGTPPQDVLPDKLYKTIDLELLAYEPAVLDSYEWFLLTAASHLGIEVGKVHTPRKSDKWRFPLLKSAHIHKKHKVHYEIRTYHKFITLKKLTGSTASTYLEYIQRNIPEGIGMKVSKLEVLPKPEYISPPPSPAHKTIRPPPS